MFDFDGTLGLVRAGWQPLMLEMMMETLGGLSADRDALWAEAEAYVARFTGKDTVHQMQAFADHVRSLGGTPRSAIEYKTEFIERIDLTRNARLAALREGAIGTDDLMVPGSRALLERLTDEGIRVYLASGTAHEVIQFESELLGIDRYFVEIHGSAPGRLGKRALLESLVESGIPPEEIVTFGDGQVEIEDTKAVGGVAVGVASDEPDCIRVDVKKREWLARAGADYIIPNFLEPELPAVIGIA
jgi:phosphoglycolate phosphatase-like HAD superfamily hydrolase